jgi:hypothetical protein
MSENAQSHSTTVGMVSDQKQQSKLLQCSTPRIVQIGVAATLIIAAAFQMSALLSSHSGELLPGMPRLFQFLFPELEFCLAIWLLSGIYPRASTLLSVFMFIGFAIVNGYSLTRGQSNCHCFGSIQVPTPLAFAIDLVAIFMLLRWNNKQERGQSAPALALANTNLVLICIAGIFLLGGAIASTVLFRNDAEIERYVTTNVSLHNFGPVPQNEVYKHVFLLHNGWVKPVIVERILSSCGCTTTEDLEGVVIRPDSTLPLPVTFQTGSIKGKKDATIQIYLVDETGKKHSWKSLLILADIGVDYILEPPILDFGTVANDEPVIKSIRIIPEKLSELKIIKIESDNQVFAPDSQAESIGLSKTVKVAFRPADSLYNGSIMGFLTVETNSTHAPTCRIPMRVILKPVVDVNPRTICVGSESSGEVLRETTISLPASAAIKSLNSNFCKCQLEPPLGLASREYRLSIRVPLPPSSQTLRTSVDIEYEIQNSTGHKEARTLTIPVLRFPVTLEKGLGYR